MLLLRCAARLRSEVREQREVRQDSTVVGASPKKYPEMTALAKLTNFDEKKNLFFTKQ